jgi:hypothetical protein
VFNRNPYVIELKGSDLQTLDKAIHRVFDQAAPKPMNVYTRLIKKMSDNDELLFCFLKV